MTPYPKNREAAGLLAGFALWSLTFALLYSTHGTICAIEESGWIGARAILIGVWAMMLVAHAVLTVWFVRRLRAATTELRFVRFASLVLSIAAFGATLWTGAPVAGLDIC